MADLTSFISIAPSNAFYFKNACNNDMLIYTESNIQNIHIGTQSNANSILQITSNQLILGSTVIPASNSTYDLGSATNRFKDIYLSGQTIDLGGTKIKTDSVSGAVSIIDQVGNYGSIFAKQLQIGDVNNSVTIKLDSTNQIAFFNASTNSILSSGGNWSNSGTNSLFVLQSNVGIGTSAPIYPLDVVGDVNFTGILRQNGVAYVGSQWSNNGANVFLYSSNVGLNTSTPEATLDVAGTVNIRSNAAILGQLTTSNVSVFNTATLCNAVNIYGETSLSNGLIVYNNGTTTLSNPVNIYGKTTTSILLSDSITINSNLSKDGLFYIGSTFNTIYPETTIINGSQTSTFNGVTYIFTNQGGNGSYSAWLYDNNSTTITFFDGLGSYNVTYNGTAAPTNGISGAFHQIQFSKTIIITSYSLSVVNDSLKEWYVFGSTNGSVWKQLDFQTFSSWIYASTFTTFNITNLTAYTYYRFVISKSFTTAPCIREFKWNSVISSEINLLSGTTSLSNTVNIYGVSTFSNALTTTGGTTTHSNPVNIYGLTSLCNALNISGDLNFNGILKQNGTAYIGSQWSNNSSNVFLYSSNVGLNTSNPGAILDVAGSVIIRSNINIYGSINNDIELNLKTSPPNYTNLIYANQIIQMNATNITSVGGYSQSTVEFQPIYYSTGGYSNLSYMRFNGNNTSNYLSLSPQTYNIKTNGGFTLSTFIKFNSNLSHPRIFTAINQGYIEISQGGLDLQFTMGNGPGNFYIYTLNNPIIIGEWALYTFRIDSTTNQVTIYKNMTQIGSGTTTYTSNVTSSTNYIGRSGNQDPYLAADISHMAIYDQYISDASLSDMLVTLQNSTNGISSVFGGNAIFNKNVGIGTSNPVYALDVAGDLQIRSNLILNNIMQMRGVYIQKNSNASAIPYNVTSIINNINGFSNANNVSSIYASNYVSIITSNIEVARFNSNNVYISAATTRINTSNIGGVLLGNTTSNIDIDAIVQIAGVAGTSAALATYLSTNVNGIQIAFNNGNGRVGSINTSATTTSFITSSDYRLKTNIAPLTNVWDKFMQLNPVTFNFKTDLNTQIQGFIAHEVQDIVPLAVSGGKDIVDVDNKPIYQGIDASKLIPLLVAALKDLKVEFEAYKATHP